MRMLRGSLLVGALAAGAFLWGCGESPSAPTLPEVETVVAGGDAQYGTAGQLLETPLHAVVRSTASGEGQAAVTVLWSVEDGDATLAGSAATVTDSTGSTYARLRLGAAPGEVRVRVTVQKQRSAWAEFHAFLVEAPRLSSLSATSANAGDTITLSGSNFSPIADQDVALFSGIRGRVVTATTTELHVEVPPCLPARTVEVTVRLGAVASQGIALAVAKGGDVTNLDVAGSLDVDDPTGLSCVQLSGAGGARYLVVALSASTVGAAEYGYTLTGLASPTAPTPTAAQAVRRSAVAARTPEFAQAFEEGIRDSEARLVRGGAPPAAATTLRAAPSLVPAVGDRRSFKVLNSAGGFDDVTGVARYVGSHGALYVDETAPQGGLQPSDLETLAAEFDEVIYPTVTGVFGMPSDIDGNGRVIILFTPAVNRLTPRGSDSFVGGFFYGLDLLDQSGSNRGEVFYALVPDPTGVYSDPRPTDKVMGVIPAILAHEFQHMVHFNQRVLKLGASNVEALWLSEGLAQMSEELVAQAYAALGDSAGVARHREGNRTRARDFLSDPSAVSLIVTTGKGSLAERGAGWLHVLYLWDRGGGNDILRRLTQTTLTGTANVTAVMGVPWLDLISDWESALYLDDLGPNAFPYEYPHVNLRDLLKVDGTGYPLDPETLGGTDFTRAGSLRSSSAHQYVVVPPSGGSLTLRLGGGAGGDAPDAAKLRLRIVRLS